MKLNINTLSEDLLERLGKEEYFYAWFKTLTEIEQGIIKTLFVANNPLPVKEIRNRFIMDYYRSIGSIAHNNRDHYVGDIEEAPLFIKQIPLNRSHALEIFKILLMVDKEFSYNQKLLEYSKILSRNGISTPSLPTLRDNLARLFTNNLVLKRIEKIRGSNELWYLNPKFRILLEKINFVSKKV